MERFCIRGFEKDQIPGRHFRIVLADGVVDAVLFGIPLKSPNIGFVDFNTGNAAILPQEHTDALLAAGFIGQ